MNYGESTLQQNNNNSNNNKSNSDDNNNVDDSAKQHLKANLLPDILEPYGQPGEADPKHV